jgi:hypothetical protein
MATTLTAGAVAPKDVSGFSLKEIRFMVMNPTNQRIVSKVRLVHALEKLWKFANHFGPLQEPIVIAFSFLCPLHFGVPSSYSILFRPSCLRSFHQSSFSFIFVIISVHPRCLFCYP